jgi:hypothetical protein
MADDNNDNLKKSLLTVAAEQGWQVALKKYSPKTLFHGMVFTDDYFKTLWRFLLPITKECNALYIGYDWGVQLEQLARQINTLTVASADNTKIAFLQLMRKQCDIRNLFLTELNGTNFFVQNKTRFDILILDGYSELLDQMQSEQIWPQVYTVLKKGGWVLCNTDMMSWAHNMVLPLIPQYIPFRDLPSASWLFSNKRVFSSISKSSQEYLARWGFEKTRIYIAIPHYRDSKVILPIDNYAVCSYFAKNWLMSGTYHIQNPIINRMNRFGDALSWLIFWCLNHLSPTASITARKITN